MNNKLKINKYILFISIIIFFDLNGFYLIDETVFKVKDITLIFEILFMGYVYIRNPLKIEYKYKWFILFPIFLVITSSIMAHFSYEQPIFMGIRPQRGWIGTLLMYFPISKLMKLNKIKPKDFIKCIDTINIVYISLGIVQFILGTKFALLHVQMNERYGEIRLYLSLSFVIISYFYHLSNYLHNKKNKVIDLIFIALTFFLLFVVIKGRMRTIVVLASTFIAFTSMKFSAKKLILAVSGVFLIVSFFSSNLGSDILNMAFDSSKSVQNTSEIRDEGRLYYLNEMGKTYGSIIFGCGFPNSDWEPAFIKTRMVDLIYANDNGIFGLMYYYGATFAIWLVFFTILLLKRSKSINDNLCFIYFLYSIIAIYTLYPELYSENIAFLIILAIHERNLQNGKIENCGIESTIK